LAAATFVFVTSETQPVALLAPMATGLHTSESAIGLLLTAYAALAALTAIPLTILASRVPRRRLLVVLVATLVVSQLGYALAPSYGWVLAARLIAALAHGVFWSIVARVAATLVAPDRVARATAMVFVGNSLALVVGTPLVSAVGALVGWRVAVACVGAAAALAVVAMAATLPDVPSEEARLDRRRILGDALRRPRLLILCVVTALIVLGQFTAYTYIAPIVRAHSGLTGTGLSAVLLAYGAAGIAAVVAVGAIADRRPRLSVLSCCAAIVAALAALSVGRSSTALTVAAVLAWGAGFTALPICLQSTVLRVAAPIPDTASALYVVAFQIGIGGGALLGALLLGGSGHVGILPVVGLSLITTGSILAAAARDTFSDQGDGGRREPPGAGPRPRQSAPVNSARGRRRRGARRSAAVAGSTDSR
jgi:predicted MFS family arabinose efflux permease